MTSKGKILVPGSEYLLEERKKTVMVKKKPQVDYEFLIDLKDNGESEENKAAEETKQATNGVAGA